ncbi:hypothetical protein BLNAU_10014 [Blattamonas nauphoetae]|uniref:WH2 domain-containing protein n=1 Tax=Blattamonas nauphoetae TaxID=2049346 RepID=A0ABQ9XUD5_9EUKA|nr:hypothetical protein BLNAU_10014 [Blattamonas nauphoetae]
MSSSFLSEIQNFKGKTLKATVTNDRSGPYLPPKTSEEEEKPVPKGTAGLAALLGAKLNMGGPVGSGPARVGPPKPKPVPQPPKQDDLPPPPQDSLPPPPMDDLPPPPPPDNDNLPPPPPLDEPAAPVQEPPIVKAKGGNIAKLAGQLNLPGLAPRGGPRQSMAMPNPLAPPSIPTSGPSSQDHPDHHPPPPPSQPQEQESHQTLSSPPFGAHSHPSSSTGLNSSASSSQDSPFAKGVENDPSKLRRTAFKFQHNPVVDAALMEMSGFIRTILTVVSSDLVTHQADLYKPDNEGLIPLYGEQPEDTNTFSPVNFLFSWSQSHLNKHKKILANCTPEQIMSKILLDATDYFDRRIREMAAEHQKISTDHEYVPKFSSYPTLGGPGPMGVGFSSKVAQKPKPEPYVPRVVIEPVVDEPKPEMTQERKLPTSLNNRRQQRRAQTVIARTGSDANSVSPIAKMPIGGSGAAATALRRFSKVGRTSSIDAPPPPPQDHPDDLPPPPPLDGDGEGIGHPPPPPQDHPDDLPPPPPTTENGDGGDLDLPPPPPPDDDEHHEEHHEEKIEDEPPVNELQNAIAGQLMRLKSKQPARTDDSGSSTPSNPLAPTGGTLSLKSTLRKGTLSGGGDIKKAGVPAKEHPKYRRFFQQLAAGMKRSFLERGMQADGLDPSMLDTPDAIVED